MSAVAVLAPSRAKRKTKQVTEVRGLSLTAPRDYLLNAVKRANDAKRGETSVPILNYTRLDCKAGVLSVTGCDGEMWASTTVPCSVSSEGAACVPSKVLNALIASLPDGDVSIEQDKGLTVSAGTSKYQLRTIDAADFPEAPKVETGRTLPITLGQLKSIYERGKASLSWDFHRRDANRQRVKSPDLPKSEVTA